MGDKASGRLEAKQAAADDGGTGALLRPRYDTVAVVDIPKTEDLRFQALVGAVDAGNRRNVGAASGRNQKLVVSLSDSGFGSDDFGGQVDFDDRRARVKHDVVLTVPTERVDENLAGLLRAAQDAGEQDPVVVPIGFVAEHHNVELITAATKQDFFHGALARHAVADNHKGEFSHISTPHFVQS